MELIVIRQGIFHLHLKKPVSCGKLRALGLGKWQKICIVLATKQGQNP